MSTTSAVADFFSSLSRRTSLRSLKSLRRKTSSSSSSAPFYSSYSVYHQTMFPSIFRDQDSTKKLLESILDMPSGRRSLSRIARTCRAVSEPALNMLWRELDSLVPLLALFPSSILKRSRRPGLGLSRPPANEDWDKFLHHGERVQRITYDETLNNVAPSIFPVLEEYRPRTLLLPNLTHLTWKVETPAGLDRCTLFLNPDLQSLTLEMNGSKFPQIDAFLSDMARRTTRLTSFSFTSHTIALRHSFTEVLAPLDESLERLVLCAPGTLSPTTGRWVLSLPKLKSLHLDLFGRSTSAVDSFFAVPISGASTPNSEASTDSGVFSGEEEVIDLTKSRIRRVSSTKFAELRQLSLTGDIAIITAFLRYLDGCPLTHLELVVEDPPQRKTAWKNAWPVICSQFGSSLQSLRITATASSRFSDLVKTTSRGEPAALGVSLESLSNMPALSRLEIDLPESSIVTPAEIERLAATCPNLQQLRLCPASRFPHSSSPPRITLESLAPLLGRCRFLHTLSVVVNAKGGTEEMLASTNTTSESLLRLNVGHSWIEDPFQVTILLSHLAPQLDTLRWFHEKNRPGLVEANANAWNEVSRALPHIRSVRAAERLVARRRAEQPVVIPPVKVDRSIDATVKTASRGVAAKPRLVDANFQCRVPVRSQGVSAKPRVYSVSVEAKPRLVDSGVSAKPRYSEQSIDVRPVTIGASVDATISTVSKYVDARIFRTDSPSSPISRRPSSYTSYLPHTWILPVIYQLLSLARTIFISAPLYIPSRILALTMSKLHQFRTVHHTQPRSPPPPAPKMERRISTEFVPDDVGSGVDEVPLHSLQQDDVFINDDHEFHGATTTTNDSEAIERNEQLHTAETEVFRQLRDNKRDSVAVQRSNKATRHGGNANAAANNMSSSENKKQERDFTPEVDALIPEAAALAKAGKLQEALDKVLVLEKQTRNVADASSTTRLAKAAVEFCYNARDYALLNSTILLLSKKHGQLKTAVQGIVEQAIGWLEDVKKRDGTDKWLEIIETLRTVTEGKIFLETPRARVTLLLAHHHEGLSSAPSAPKDSLITASDLLSDLQVETYSSMERREKTEFILEQMRLLVAVATHKDEQSGKDSLSGGEAEWVKVRVSGRKINEDFLKEKDNEDLKLKFYELMIQYALKHDSFLDVTKYYYKVWETPSIKEDVNGKGKAALEHIVYYIVLAPHNNEQSDMIHHLFVDPALTKLELHYNLIKCFTTRELMRWPGIEALYGPFLQTTPVFSQPKRWEDLHTRVIEHNIRVIAEYYTRVTVDRLTSLLDLTPQQTEETLARLVVSGTIWARIDRPAGIVNFRRTRSAEDVMNDWSSDMQKLLSLVEKTWMGMNAALAAVKA